jgi:ligand-binding SRPBCC domain-containing protein
VRITWVHTHEFEDVPGGTRMRDIVEYEIGWSPLGALAHAIFVRRALRRSFHFRRTAVEEVSVGATTDPRPIVACIQPETGPGP